MVHCAMFFTPAAYSRFNPYRIHRVIHPVMILAGCIAGVTPAQAQKPETPQSVILNPINITATRSERSPEQIPNSITQITRTPQHNYQPGA
ncbi:MAG: hypothetical protein LZF63_11385, partial [Nitrosomonas sp.]|nr:hypothetical protein [Nitrosomonas sp.]